MLSELSMLSYAMFYVQIQCLEAFTCSDSFGPEADQPQTHLGSDTGGLSTPVFFRNSHRNTANFKGEWSLIPDTGTQALQLGINEQLTRHR